MNQDKIFIPASIEDVAYRRANYFFSDKKAALIVVLILAYALIALMLLPLLKTAVGLIGFILFLLFTGQLYIRKVIIEENRWLSIFNHNKENKVSSIGSIWNIYDFQDKYVKYINQIKGVAIKLEMGSIVGKSANFEQRHFGGMETFYRNLIRNNLHFMVMNIEEKPKMPENIIYLENLLKKETNENLRDLLRIEINHMKKALMARQDQENTYIFIYTNQVNVMRELTNIEFFLKILMTESGFKKYRILDKQEFLELSQNIHGIKYIDFEELLLKSDVDLTIKPFKVVKKLDNEGYDLIDFEDDLPAELMKEVSTGEIEVAVEEMAGAVEPEAVTVSSAEDNQAAGLADKGTEVETLSTNAEEANVIENPEQSKPNKSNAGNMKNASNTEIFEKRVKLFKREIEDEKLFIDDLNDKEEVEFVDNVESIVKSRTSVVKKPDNIKKLKESDTAEYNLEGHVMPNTFTYKVKE